MNSTMNSSKQNMSEDSSQDLLKSQMVVFNQNMGRPDKCLPTKNELIEELKLKDFINDDNKNSLETLSKVSSQFNQSSGSHHQHTNKRQKSSKNLLDIKSTVEKELQELKAAQALFGSSASQATFNFKVSENTKSLSPVSIKGPTNDVSQSFMAEANGEREQQNAEKMGILINSYKKEGGKKVAFDQSTKFNNNDSPRQDENIASSSIQQDLEQDSKVFKQFTPRFPEQSPRSQQQGQLITK